MLGAPSLVGAGISSLSNLLSHRDVQDVPDYQRCRRSSEQMPYLGIMLGTGWNIQS